MASIATLAVQLTAITAPFSRGMKAAASPVRMFGNAINSANSKLGALAAGFISVAAIGKGVQFIKTQMESLDALGKVSDQLGISVETLKAYQIGARKAGVENDALVQGFTKFAASLSRAASGQLPAMDRLFDSLGLDAGQLQQLGTEEAIRLTADAILNLDSQLKKLGVSTQLFGKSSGRDFLTFIEDGSAGLDAMMQDAKRLGSNLGRIDISEIEAANDAWEDMHIAMENVGGVIALKVAPFITDFSTRFAEAAAQGTEFGDKFTNGLRIVAKGIAFVGDGWKVLQIIIQSSSIAIDVMIERVLTGVSKIVHGFNSINKWANQVFGENTKMIPTDWLDDFISNLRTGINEADTAFKKYKNDTPWKSDQVDKYFDTVIEKSREAAMARVTDNNIISDSEDELDKKRDKLDMSSQGFGQTTRMGVMNYLRNVARGTQINGARISGPGAARVQEVHDPQMQQLIAWTKQVAKNTEDNTAVAA